MPTVRAIARAAANDQYRFGTLILGVVESAPFQMSSKAALPAASDAGSSTVTAAVRN
jgi:hypothetical protein